VITRPLATHAGESTALPLEERIRLRAHQLYIERGNESGSEMDHCSRPRKKEELGRNKYWGGTEDWN
jgi:hypothetical protein